jgi:hypothetical protein
VKGEAGGDVQQPVAQALGLRFGELAVEQQALGPCEQVVRDRDLALIHRSGRPILSDW